MARKRLPADAFEYYYGLGSGRSYRAVAEHFGVSKTTVANRAERDGWLERVRGREAEVSRRLEKKARPSS
jgi:transposase